MASPAAATQDRPKKRPVTDFASAVDFLEQARIFLENAAECSRMHFRGNFEGPKWLSLCALPHLGLGLSTRAFQDRFFGFCSDAGAGRDS